MNRSDVRFRCMELALKMGHSAVSDIQAGALHEMVDRMEAVVMAPSSDQGDDTATLDNPEENPGPADAVSEPTASGQPGGAATSSGSGDGGKDRAEGRR